MGSFGIGKALPFTRKSATVSSDWIWTLTSMGTGASVGDLSVGLSQATTFKLTGSGYFTDTNGSVNLGQSISVPSGSSMFTIVDAYKYLTGIDDWQTDGNAPSVSFDIKTLPNILQALWISGDNTISGSFTAISDTFLDIGILGDNTITGTIPSFPSSMDSFEIYGKNTISGTIPSLPGSMASFLVKGQNTLSGSIPSLPSSLSNFDVEGQNSLSGSIPAPFSANLVTFIVTGNNTLSGTLGTVPRNVSYLTITGNNTISGSLAFQGGSSMSNITIKGNNTLTSSTFLLPINCVTFDIEGNNTLSGSLSSVVLNTISTFIIKGNNTLSGTLPRMSSSQLDVFDLEGHNSVNGLPALNYTPTIGSFTFIPYTGGLSAAYMSTFIQGMSAKTWTGNKVLTLTGTNAAPTPSTSLTNAENILINTKMVTVTTN
jgi:hypothetical protein